MIRNVPNCRHSEAMFIVRLMASGTAPLRLCPGRSMLRAMTFRLRAFALFSLQAIANVPLFRAIKLAFLPDIRPHIIVATMRIRVRPRLVFRAAEAFEIACFRLSRFNDVLSACAPRDGSLASWRP